MLNWEDEAAALLKAELRRSKVTHKALAKKLAAIGVVDNAAAISSKLARGKFTFCFFLQCLTALGLERVVIPLPVVPSEPKGLATDR